MSKTKLMLGNNLDSLKKLPDNSIDSVVTDPPYGLSFMNKKWDYDVPSVDFWKEVYRVLKPGGHILSFGGSRTYHRMVVNVEDAGFEIRDTITWLYGSGFPKSLNVGKTIEKFKKTGNASWNGTGDSSNGALGYSKLQKEQGYRAEDYSNRHQNKTEIDNEWEGWGTSLKPASEYIVLARKPLSEKSVAENVLKWKTGGINVDGSRVGSETHEGRFPANIILECICDEVIKGEKGEPFNYKGKEYNNKDTSMFNGDKPEAPSNYNDKGDTHTNPNCPCYLLDEQSGVSKSIKSNRGGAIDSKSKTYNWNNGDNKPIDKYECGFTDKGGASRFFYQAKVSKAERNMGLDGIILQLSNFCISIDYNNKEFKLWESTDQKARHQEVMELLTQKDIDELQLKKVMENTICEWSTGSYGNNTMDLYQMVATFITLMVTNLITELKILNVLIEQNTNENISECILKTEFGGNIVANVMSGNPKNIIIEQKKDGCQDNVNLVELNQQLKINVKENKNIHATIKPVNLMTYLCRLITPQGGIVLDPFMGSGSTGIAAQLEGFKFVGMEMDEDYFKIASARIENFEKYRKFLK
jgi:site-specific DNA-methyltransferase (adenine-specific)